jgi:eukaryotic-like serine/threonine-protein kinase
MQPGQLLCDQYRIEKPLAAGGFGETFLAVDTDLPSKPLVVVKLLKPQRNDPATLQVANRLFSQEAEILERLGKDNPRIPTLHAHFELNREFYLVQEYIKGKTLTEELQGRKLSESDTISILNEILTGLKTVHPHVIHRDLKPDNIIRRDRDRQLVLIDFGAVKQVRTATNPNLVSTTINIGTPGYMPNEQSMGYPKPASDIYAVGAVSVLALSQMGKKSPDIPPEIDLPEPVDESPTRPSLSGNAPKLTKIQFTSVKLNAKGVIIAKPPGTAQIYFARS